MKEFDFRTLAIGTWAKDGDGDRWKIVSVDATKEYPIVGVMESGLESCTWTWNGYSNSENRGPCRDDLVPPKQTTTYERWLVVETTEIGTYTVPYRTRQAALDNRRALHRGGKIRIIHLHGEIDMDDNSVLEVRLP